MARQKNAKRQHEIAPFGGESTAPTTAGWLPIAKYIETISENTDEDVESVGFYDGDGTPEENVLNVVLGYDFEGFRDAEDAAQNLIVDLKLATGTGRRVWHRVTHTDGRVYTGLANVTEIVSSGGEATADEGFGCTIRYVQRPTLTRVI